MTPAKQICLLNDAFPPIIDGVSNAVVNYAVHLRELGYGAMVVTPANPEAKDSDFSFPVIRYPSFPIPGYKGYTAGLPFTPETARIVSEKQPQVLHCHCPIVSAVLARELRQIVDAPIVMTYHTKFDVDLEHITKIKPLRESCKKILAENISACDEVWTVSKGAGENLRQLGYMGEWRVMPNGVDLPKERLAEEKIREAVEEYDLPADAPVYLFVGRMMWYKGIRIILDALAKLLQEGQEFRMVFIGDGFDSGEIRKYAEKSGIGGNCLFLGSLRDREALRAWYCRADLFLFPSTFDTNGLVVREAASCSLASVLIRGSCAAEDVTEGRNGFLVEENAESLAACLMHLTGERDTMKRAGECAAEELYMHWSDAVKLAAERYETVIDRYKRGLSPAHKRPAESFMRMSGELMETVNTVRRWLERL